MSESTREAFERILAEMKELQSSGDTERAHGDADGLLCEMLSILGYYELVSAFRAVDKWYA